MTNKKNTPESEEVQEIILEASDQAPDVEVPAEKPIPEPPASEHQPEPAPEKVERRGRKKGGKNRPKAKTQPKPKDEADEIDHIINQHNQASAPEPAELAAPEPEEVKKKGKISGLILLTVIDAIAPILLLKVAGMVNKSFKKVNVQNIRLTPEEKQDLSEIADEVAAMIDANPIILLSISLGGIYMAKITSEI